MPNNLQEALRLLKALPFFGISLFEISVTFVRVFILTHILGPYEFGFAAVLSATYATIEQVTDIAIFRFVSSSPRSIYSEAVAGAHALNILRGLVLASGVLIASYPLACTFAACNDWPSFAWLAPVTMIKSFAHLEIGVGERDYRYRSQLIASIISHSTGIAALTAFAYQRESHYAFIVYLLVQASVYVAASHYLASTPYRARFSTPYFYKAFVFGFPLVMNGIGLAIVGQGDRLMVGALLGLPTLGLYAVVVLAGLVPISGFLRILGSLFFAGLHNTQTASARYIARLRLFSRMMPMIAGCYALALNSILKPAIPLVFGARFMPSNLTVFLIALIAFVRIVRVEPHTSLLLSTQRTRELAFANLSPVIGLAIAAGLVMSHPTIEAALTGVLVGEIAGLFSLVFATRDLLRRAFPDYLIFVLVNLTAIGMAGVLELLLDVSNSFLGRTAISSVILILIVAAAIAFLPQLYRKAYGTRKSK